MIDFQRAASEQGTQFRNACMDALRYAGFEIIGLEFGVPEVGITLDIHARNKRDIDFLIECKGSMRGERPGCKRTDTAKKAIANGYLLAKSDTGRYFPPMLLMTSHVAQSGDALAMFNRVDTWAVLDVLNPYNHSRVLARYATWGRDDIEAHMSEYPELGALLEVRWCVSMPRSGHGNNGFEFNPPTK